MAPRRTLLAAAAAAVLPFASAQSVSVSFDLGWRQFTGSPTAPPACNVAYNVSFNGVQVNGLTHAPEGDASAALCMAAACAHQQQLWQWCPGSGVACGVQSCWVGSASGAAQPQQGWQSSAFNGTFPPPPPSPAVQPGYDDSAWQVVDLPHDFLIETAYDKSADGGEAFIPFNFSYYRKTFNLPAGWQGSHISLRIEGATSVSSWYVNGQTVLTNHWSAYTPITLRIDNIPGLLYGPGAANANVLAAFVDAGLLFSPSGWWYEGGGLTRHVTIVSAPHSAHLVPYGESTPSYTEGMLHERATTAEGLYADTAFLNPSAEVENTGTAETTAVVSFTLLDVTGAVVTTQSATAKINATETALVHSPTLTWSNAELWSVPRPYLYTLAIVVSVGGTAVDAINISVGVRDVAWNPDAGLFLNQQAVKIRGFCNHESFTGVGAAVPDRIDLLRIQQMRGLGGNGWRTSHNAPEPALLALADRLGIVVLDENRIFATQTNCPGCPDVPTYNGDQVQDFIDLIRRDRTHASIAFWSACNEAGCGDGRTEPALDFRLAAYANDGSRSFSANMGWLSPTHPTNMSDLLDVMGFSHPDYGTVLAFHQQEPGKPLVANECCSCETQRGEDNDLKPDWNPTVYFSNENSGCLRDQTNVAITTPWMAGEFVWTLHDYVGEPGNWPHVSSSFGAYDLAGFVKAPVYWYRSWWMANVSESDAGRPPVPGTSTFVHIVESWQAPPAGKTTRDINVYTNAPFAQLLVNGSPVGSPVAVKAYTAASFNGVTYAAGNLTAVALAADGATVLLADTKLSWGAPAAVLLTLDVPSAATGTGSAVYLDGEDVALVRATIVDAAGAVVHDSSLNVTFAVTAGPAIVAGVGNGDPANQEPNRAASRSAYHGLVRGIVRVNLDASGSAADRALAASINTQAGQGPKSSTIFQGDNSLAPTSITVSASAPGLPTATLTIPLSVDPGSSVLAVAASSVGAAYIGE
jgi:hypothetical protein